MSERIHALAQLLLGKSSIEECSLEEIKQLTENHPYFAPAQFLLLQKLKIASSPEAEAQRQKAILYYHDPIQFDYFISPEKFYVDESFLESPAYDEILAEDNFEETFTNKELVEDKTNSVEEEESLVFEEAETKEVFTPNELQPNANSNHPVAFETTTEKDTVGEKPNGIDHAEIAEEPIVVDQPESKLTQEISEEKEVEDVDNSSDHNEPVVHDSPLVFSENEADSPIAEQLTLNNDQNKPATISTREEVLAFEPYHTVDYFASQGIKVSVDEAPKDKLAKQLRSFTEWLKIMKRLPVTEMTKTPETTAEKTVEKLATHSVADNDVVTEAMAEVWAKQGAHEKAIETYNKLCLLNPSKRAYFAAKIENLKQS